MKKTHKTHKKYKKHKKNRKHTHKNIYKGGFWSFLNSQNNPNADGEVEAKFDFWGNEIYENETNEINSARKKLLENNRNVEAARLQQLAQEEEARAETARLQQLAQEEEYIYKPLKKGETVIDKNDSEEYIYKPLKKGETVIDKNDSEEYVYKPLKRGQTVRAGGHKRRTKKGTKKRSKKRSKKRN